MFKLRILPMFVALHYIATTKVQAQTVKVSSAKVDFGDSFTVTFDNPNPLISNYIGIYKKGFASASDEEMWAGMCGDQGTWNNAAACPPQPSGSVTFAVTDPDQESDSQWPLNPGDYQACLGHYHPIDGYDILACADFKIKALHIMTANKSSLTLSKSNFAVNEAIIATFHVVGDATPNTWIGIYNKEVNPELSDLGEPYLWVYSACNNQDGDQGETNNCAATKSVGTIQIDATSQDRSAESWPLAEGEYKLCMSFFNNSPYSKFVCSSKFTVGDPATDATVTLRFKNQFGASIGVTFDNPNPTSTNWLAIHDIENVGAKKSIGSFWSSMCGDQTSWNDPILCPAQTSGSVTFAAADPDQENSAQFPLNPGWYKMCLMDDLPYDYTYITCEEFRVRGISTKVIENSSVTPAQRTFAVNKPITADFVSTPKAFINTWIGLYRSSDVTATTEKLGKPMLWVYTGCNNQDGNQSETNNCTIKKQAGSIQIDGTNQDRSVESWPVGAGSYVLCMSFFTNEPYKKFVCSNTFTVAET